MKLQTPSVPRPSVSRPGVRRPSVLYPGILFFAIIQPSLGYISSNFVEISYITKETIIYRLRMINPYIIIKFVFYNFDILVHFWREIGMATTGSLRGLDGFKIQLRNWPTRWIFWVNYYLKFVFLKVLSLQAETPILLITGIVHDLHDFLHD